MARESSKESLGLLVSSHDLKSVWLVAHQGCGFYRKKYGEMGEEELHSRQLRDLKKAREWLQGRQLNLEVHCIYAMVKGDLVLFVEVEEKAG